MLVSDQARFQKFLVGRDDLEAQPGKNFGRGKTHRSKKLDDLFLLVIGQWLWGTTLVIHFTAFTFVCCYFIPVNWLNTIIKKFPPEISEEANCPKCPPLVAPLDELSFYALLHSLHPGVKVENVRWWKRKLRKNFTTSCQHSWWPFFCS